MGFKKYNHSLILGNEIKMFILTGYAITELIHESANSYIYRAIREKDNKPVVLKILKQDYPPPEKIAWFKREYEITQDLHEIRGIINVYALESDQNRWYIVLEDFGGHSLDRLNTAEWSLSYFLKIAIETTKILGQLHQRHMIHKDLNPSNLLLNPSRQELKLIDFGISTILSRENTSFRNPDLLEGTLAYLSPEQTGRMNRAIDYRSDFYSLGVTFYELLTGQLPFLVEDALELVHCHIARQPIPPHAIKSELPPILSDIILKLMAKNAEDRYQSSYGLKADLAECLTQWQRAERIEPFCLAQTDVSDRFEMPQKLYGREQEFAQLIAGFDRVSQGGSEMMLVAGYSGVGKSALVQEVYKPLTQKKGYFIAGKFDQFQRDIPYASLIQAFRSLMRQLLTETETAIARWRKQLLQALGINGEVMIDVIPELEQVIGPQPTIPELGPTEAQNRFNLVFQNFIKVFTQPAHPLVLFLDDLQWADGASLNLIHLLMTVHNSQYFFLIGAYRDNEVTQAHPFMLTLEEIKKSQAVMHTLTLSPLSTTELNQLISDTLHCDLKRVQPLADLLKTKTGGNPFFVTEFLKTLFTEQLLTFNYNKGQWQWNLAQIQAKKMTDNIVELMANKVEKLPKETLSVLKLAACIGNQFYLETLAIVFEQSSRKTATALNAAITEGFILPLNDSYKLMELEVEGITKHSIAYKFAHDRIQQAVYSLIIDTDKQTVHLKIGRLLLQHTPKTEIDHYLFDIVNQFNQGQTFIEEQDERYTLAHLNLLAGKKAKASTAYQSAFIYLQVGIGLLGENSWQQQYELTLKLYEEIAETAYLSGHFEQMENFVDVVLQHASTLLDKVPVYKSQIQARMAQGQFLEAVEVSLSILKLLEVTFPEAPNQEEIILGFQETKLTYLEKSIEEFINLPEMTDQTMLAVMQILWVVATPCYIARQDLFPLMVFKRVSLSMKYGNTANSIQGYAFYGLLLSGFFDEIESGYQFGQIALRLLEKFSAKEHYATTYLLVGHFINHWKEHNQKAFSFFIEGYKNGLAMGNLEYGSLNAATYCIDFSLIGKRLLELEAEMQKYGEALIPLKQDTMLNWHKMFWQATLNLLGKNENPCHLSGEVFNEDKMLPVLLEINEKSGLFNIHFIKLILNFLFLKYSESVINADKAEEYSSNAAGGVFFPIFYFYTSLAKLAIYPSVPDREKKQFIEKVTANQNKMKLWASHAPMNYQHKYDLVEAERARVLGNYGDAREYYDKAIAGAHENEYLNEESLAYELAGRFYLERELKHFAEYYLKNAHYTYQQWGAIAKVKDLEERYPDVLAASEKVTHSESFQKNATTITGTYSVENLDLATVMKASQAISGEMVLDKLLTQLMTTVIENAGAQKGFLILKNTHKEWVIEAEGIVDSKEVATRQGIAIDSEDAQLSPAIVNYVARTQESVVLNDAVNEGEFKADAYILAQQPKSLLCTPLLNQGQLSGILYLENNLTTGAFTSDRLAVLQLLSSQAAISIDNAKLYTNMTELNEELKMMDKLKDDFLANTSHELRTPLNGIIGITESLLDGAGGPLSDQQITNLSMVVSSGKRLNNLVNYILDFSKLRRQDIELSRKPVDFQPIAHLVFTLSQPLLKDKAIELRNEIPKDLPAVYGDEDRLQQILHNLLGNAIKFTAQGTVTLSAKMQEDQVAVTVADTGIGIPEDKFDAIFQSFEQVDASTAREYGGTGLGLSVTKQLVELHGGTITVTSKLGQGSQFTFTLPQSTQTPVAKKELSTELTKVREDESSTRIALPPLAAEGDFTILAVDDDLVNLQVLVNMLSLENYQVKTATGGGETLEMIEQEGKPDLILLDIMMPKITGYQVCQTLREKSNATELPIILLTAKNQVSDLVTGLSLGANDYLTKPVSKHELLARIKTHLNLSHLKNENIRLRAELDIAKKLQQMLLPAVEELGEITSLEIAGFMEPADEVGGDYYDVWTYNGQLKLGIGDATGHGLESGILAMMVQTSVKTLLEHGETDPVKFLSTINKTIYDNAQRMCVNKNMSLSLLDYFGEGRMRLSGQHEDVILVKNGEIELVDTGELGFPVGLDEDIAEFVSATEVKLEAGDVAVFYTDGITEAENLERELYGIERLCEIIKANWQRSAHEIKEAVINDVREYIGKQIVYDDITLLVLKQ
jgi:predicted ATPase/signal transduction histidine kinase/serine phosphatase RsbU (regulator of sigma subunit)/tRNA A-37 threonylcarbamoyl transferase component Bud32